MILPETARNARPDGGTDPCATGATGWNAPEHRTWGCTLRATEVLRSLGIVTDLQMLMPFTSLYTHPRESS